MYTLNMCNFLVNQLCHHKAVLKIKSRASKKKKGEQKGAKLGLRKKTWKPWKNEDEVILRKC